MKRLVIACTFAAVVGLGIAAADETKPAPVFLPEVKETACTVAEEVKDVVDLFDDKKPQLQACVFCCSTRDTCCCGITCCQM